MKENTKPQASFFKTIGSEDGPIVLITAGVHGDEYEPIITAMRLRYQLFNKLRYGQLWIVTVVNTTAYMAGSRYGSDGLDLARICPGNDNGSETEMEAFSISELIKKADYFIDMHTGGSLFDIFPLVGYMMHSNTSVLESQRMMAMSFNLPIIWGTDDQPNGRTLSVARDANVPAIYVEFGGGGTLNEKVIESYFKGCIHVLESLNMISTNDTNLTSTKYWIEDGSPESGYLQGKMLSNFDGVFVATVKLGQKVKKGQIWGNIYEPVANLKHEILAESDGIVLFIRKEPRVYKADSLGGILSLTNNRMERNDQ